MAFEGSEITYQFQDADLAEKLAFIAGMGNIQGAETAIGALRNWLVLNVHPERKRALEALERIISQLSELPASQC